MNVISPIFIFPSSSAVEYFPSYNSKVHATNEVACQIPNEIEISLWTLTATITSTNLVDGQGSCSLDTLVPQQKPPLDNDLEYFIIGEQWPGCEFVDQSPMVPTDQNAGISGPAQREHSHRDRLSTCQGQWVHDIFVLASGPALRLSTLTPDETKSPFFPRTRSRIFGLINFSHFFVGSSYAVKSARCRSVDRGHVMSPSGRTAIFYATHVPVSVWPVDAGMVSVRDAGARLQGAAQGFRFSVPTLLLQQCEHLVAANQPVWSSKIERVLSRPACSGVLTPLWDPTCTDAAIKPGPPARTAL